MPRMLDIDTKTERIVKEYIVGKTVYELVLKDKLPDACLHQIKEMCQPEFMKYVAENAARQEEGQVL